MMKVLFVVSGTARVAASRYRVYQYLPILKGSGVSFDVVSTISDLATSLSIRSPEFNQAARFLYYILIFVERFFRFWPIFIRARRYDIIFLQRATFPFGQARLLKLVKKVIIFDIDDAIFLPDTQERTAITAYKAFIKQKELRDSLSVSDCIIVENEYIKTYCSRYCSNIHKIPGPIDTERYYPLGPSLKERGDTVIIGWIGSPATTSYLRILDRVFKEIFSMFPMVRLMLIGAGRYECFDRTKVIKRSWRYDTEVEDLQKFDIGIMPMPDDEWTKGKLGCKMLQYMAIGVPSVVSFTSTNEEVIRNGSNGFLVRSDREWAETLSVLIKDRPLRERIGKAGRETVLELCSVRKNAPRLMEIFRNEISK